MEYAIFNAFYAFKEKHRLSDSVEEEATNTVGKTLALRFLGYG